MNKKPAIVICNGEVPKKSVLVPYLHPKPFIVCADGGANKARSLGLRPDVIVGDLDSVFPSTVRFFSGVSIRFKGDQESTDLEKALDYLLSLKHRSVVVVGATGQRTDHTLANFSILLKYRRKMNIRFIDPHADIFVVGKRLSVRTVPGQTISLVPMGKCSGITTRGLYFPLALDSLEPGTREGVSNRATGLRVAVSVRKGSLLLFRNFTS